MDRFEIRELIGEGGMGAIYRAVDTKIGRTVALKVVRAARLGSTSGDQARQRFLREALAISKVDHRNVVRVLDFGFSGDTPYLAMEYLRGRDLGKLLKASADFLPIADVIDTMLGVCAAIRACHDVGIIHRDLKPSNIFLCEGDSERVVKILDFGVSKPPIAGDLTREGQIIGTPQYLAPEQVDGNAVPQTDQYAIGVMLYACFTRTLPYQDYASFGLLRAIVAGKFKPPRALRADLPEKLEAIVLRAMRTAPAERFESVHALGRELWAFASPAAREQWRSYYLADPLRAPPKASTHAMPLIEAMARGLAGRGPIRNAAALAPTATAEPALAAQRRDQRPRAAADDPKTATDDSASASASASGGATPASASGGATPATNAPTPPTALERVPGEIRAGRRPTAALVAAAALALAGAAWFILGRPAGTNPPKTVPPSAAVPVAAPPAPVPVAPPREPVPVAPPHESAPVAQPPAPAPVAPPPAPVPVTPPVRWAPEVARPPTPPAPALPAHDEKRPRHNHQRPPAEHAIDAAKRTPEGVPIMP